MLSPLKPMSALQMPCNEIFFCLRIPVYFLSIFYISDPKTTITFKWYLIVSWYLTTLLSSCLSFSCSPALPEPFWWHCYNCIFSSNQRSDSCIPKSDFSLRFQCFTPPSFHYEHPWCFFFSSPFLRNFYITLMPALTTPHFLPSE